MFALHNASDTRSPSCRGVVQKEGQPAINLRGCIARQNALPRYTAADVKLASVAASIPFCGAHRQLQHLPLESRSPTTASRPPKGSSEFLASRMQHARTVDAPPARGMTTEKAGHETNGRSMTTDERGMPRAANAPRAGKRLSVVIVRESGRSSKYRPFCKASLPLQSPRTGYWMPRLRGA